jgi:hypothetical protein
MRISRLFACLLAVCTVACGEENPNAPSNLPGQPFTELFIGTLAVGGSSFYSIGFPETTQVRVTLVGLSSATGVLTPTTVSLRLGVPSGTTCAPSSTANVVPGFTPQIISELQTGTYCVGIADGGGLTQPTNFLIRIHQIPTSSIPPRPPAPTQETFASNLAVRGTSARTFEATGGGQVTVTLQNIGPPASVTVDMSLGIPRTDGTGCLVTQTFRGGAGLQFSAQVDAGPYCTMLSDFGDLTVPVSFTVVIAKP